MVRRGIAELIAQGPLPASQDGSGTDQDLRKLSLTTEAELATKFNAIVDHMLYGKILDCESWYKAGQCLILKADLIADRICLQKGFLRSEGLHQSTP
jgi:hypothetical protein